MTEPILTGILAETWAAKPDKPTALGTPLRYSGSHGCARQMAYTALGAVKTDPMDSGDSWAPGIGTVIHEAMQDAIASVYKTAQFEYMSQLGKYISGATDALVTSQEILDTTGVNLYGTHVLWELKSMGEWAFDKQVGYNRKSLKVFHREGPKIGAITQAGMNALGIEAGDSNIYIQTILMGSVCVSALSVNKARAMGLSGFDRYGAEFRIGRDEWEPLARAELARLDAIGEKVAAGVLPDRIAIADNGGDAYLNPRGKDWQCDYCAFRALCVSDGEGEIATSDSWMTRVGV